MLPARGAGEAPSGKLTRATASFAVGLRIWRMMGSHSWPTVFLREHKLRRRVPPRTLPPHSRSGRPRGGPGPRTRSSTCRNGRLLPKCPHATRLLAAYAVSASAAWRWPSSNSCSRCQRPPRPPASGIARQGSPLSAEAGQRGGPGSRPPRRGRPRLLRAEVARRPKGIRFSRPVPGPALRPPPLRPCPSPPLPRRACSPSTRQGYLDVRSARDQTWRKRWFVLEVSYPAFKRGGRWPEPALPFLPTS